MSLSNFEHFKVAIIGSGPAGLSAASRAAELGVSHVLLEAESLPINTIRKYQRRKHVMAEPGFIPLRSSVPFSAGIREPLLKSWESHISQQNINLRVNERVVAISGEQPTICIETARGSKLTAEFVILAIGVQGNIRKLGVVGENLPMVQYQLDDPGAFVDETIVVVGAGDSGVENALALSETNRVILLNRDREFNRCNEENRRLLLEAHSDFIIETRLECRIAQAVAIKQGGFPLMLTLDTPQGEEKLACHRVIARLGAEPPRKLLEDFGIKFASDERSASPALTEHHESSIKGLYVVGALGGVALIKPALNQGYEVIEHILGNAVLPADALLLEEKLSGFLVGKSMTEKMTHIQQSVPIFAHLTALQLRELILESQLLQAEKGQSILKHLDYNTSFFTVLSGKVQLVSENKKTSSLLGAGDFFGENGLFSALSASEAAIAIESSVILETPKRVALNLLGRISNIRETLESTILARALHNYFELAVPQAEIDQLVRQGKALHYDAENYLYREGDICEGLYFLKNGSVAMTKSGHRFGLVTAGQFLGESELLTSSLRMNNAMSVSAMDVILLPHEALQAMLSRHADVFKHLNFRFLQTLKQKQNTQSVLETHSANGQQVHELVGFMMNQGLREATDLLVMDYDKCIGCDACEQACADSHGGVARLKRAEGPTLGDLHVPVACRHCEHPHCMTDCPPNAIRRSVTGEVFINDTCIGCGNCVKNCPYDAIQMVESTLNAKTLSLFEVIAELVTGSKKSPPTSDNKAAKLAVKCDLCHSFIEGPACVRACPTGAAMRTHPEALMYWNEPVVTAFLQKKQTKV